MVFGLVRASERLYGCHPSIIQQKREKVQRDYCLTIAFTLDSCESSNAALLPDEIRLLVPKYHTLKDSPLTRTTPQISRHIF